MKPVQIFFVAFLVIFSSCERIIIDKSAPDCIRDKAREFAKSEFTCNSGASVTQLIFQGKYVYAFDPGTCGADMMSEVYDENCNYLGGLGGITGKTKINDVEFSEAEFQKVIWHN